jgi:ATP-dependent Clp protease ATP-binding subunit ClpA
VLERFSDSALQVVVLAQRESRLLDREAIGPEHLLLGLTCDAGSIAAQVLRAAGISLDGLREELEQADPHPQEVVADRPWEEIFGSPFTLTAMNVFVLSLREAMRLGYNRIEPEHILLGIVRDGENRARTALVNLGADPEALHHGLIESVGRAARRFGDSPHSLHRVPPGVSVTVRAVRPGLNEQAYEAAYKVLGDRCRRLGLSPEREDVQLRGIHTERGPGVELSFTEQLGEEAEESSV